MSETNLTTKFDYPLLVVEDNLLMRKILEASLREAGYDVVLAENGQEALKYFARQYFPIVMTDWIMPIMDGIELCRAIRSRSSERYTYVIMLTAQDSKEDKILGLEAGADEYLIKPVNQAELVVRLKTARRILQLERSLQESLDEIRNLSVQDPLTGIFNRRYLDDRLPQEVKRAYRYNRPLSLIMLDLDNFKRINDTYGHHVGDLVLQRCVDSITGCIRAEIDWLSRYGGEEFLLVLPETDPTGAQAVAERLRSSIAEMVLTVNNVGIRITASFGVVCLTPQKRREKLQAQALLEYADSCLYQAKKEGRNRVKGILV